MLRTRFLILAFSFLSSFASATPLGERLRHLMMYPHEIARLSAGNTLDGQALVHFSALFRDPLRIGRVLADKDKPFQFREFLLWKIHEWTRDGSFPNRQRETTYLLQFLQAFKDDSVDPAFREKAYQIFAFHIFRGLSARTRASVVRSLQQHAIDPDLRPWAIPALILTEPNMDRVRTRFLHLPSESRDCQLRALEVLRFVEARRNDRSIQQHAVHLLGLSTEPRIIEAAERALTLRPNGNLVDRNILKGPALHRLTELIKPESERRQEEKKVPEAVRVAAARILGTNFKISFFVPKELVENETIHAYLAEMLLSGTDPEKAAAVGAFREMKPADERSQLALVTAAFTTQSQVVMDNAFNALGVNSQHRGDHRVRSERTRALIAASMLERASRKKLSDLDESCLESGAEVLARNTPKEPETFFLLFKTLQKEPPDRVVGKILTTIKAVARLEIKGPEAGKMLAELASYMPLSEELLGKVDAPARAYVEAVIASADNEQALTGLRTQIRDLARPRWLAFLTEVDSDDLLERVLSDNRTAHAALAGLATTDVSLIDHPRALRQILAWSPTNSNAAEIARKLGTITARARWVETNDEQTLKAVFAAITEATRAHNDDLATKLQTLLTRIQRRKETGCGQDLINQFLISQQAPN